jgi:hypothetical protein
LFNASLQGSGNGQQSVTVVTFLTFWPMLLALVTSAPADNRGVRTLIVQDQLILRVPVRPPLPPIDWAQRKGPKCIAAEDIRGAFLSKSDHVDFVMAGRRLVRAQLHDNCPALDFYEGFYLNSNDDRICAKRDVVRSRVGASCRIEKFNELVPKRRR